MDANDQNRLMQCNTDGSDIQPFFSKQSYSKRDTSVDLPTCSCPIDPSIDKSFTIDHSNSKNKPLLIFVDSKTHDVISADRNGCNCDIVTSGNLISNSLPLNTLKSDFGTLYWINSTQGLVYSIRKSESNIPNRKHLNAQNILIFGSHMQPYPPHKCLIPKYGENVIVSLLQKTATSLTLLMPSVRLNSDCQNVSMPTIEYRIFYMPYNNEEYTQCTENCKQVVTFNKAITIEDLQPFTKYIFSLVVGNYFSQSMEDGESMMGPAVIFQTSVGGNYQ